MKKSLSVGIISLFILSALAPITGGYYLKISDIKQSSNLINCKTLYVGGYGPGNYTKIQDAIDDAVDCDTVYVYDDSSPYYENIVVNVSINLIGEYRKTTIIDGGEIGVDAVFISVDNVNINGFTIQNSGSEFVDVAGIKIYSQYSTIVGNNISNNMLGIWLWDSNSNIITGNKISNNFGGIWLDNSNNNIISGNNILDSYDSIFLVHSSSHNIITDNIISGNETGIVLGDSSSNTITNNTISDNNYGIGLGASNSNIITGNIINSNKCIGISLGSVGHSSCNNTITGNTISNNGGFGISIGYFKYPNNDNIIYHNNFIKNGWNADDESDNIWDDGKYGNYWDDYKEKHPFAMRSLLKPWMWNIPYNIPSGGNKDRCPLVNQWPNPKPRTITRDTASYDSLSTQLLELFPILKEVILRLVR